MPKATSGIRGPSGCSGDPGLCPHGCLGEQGSPATLGPHLAPLASWSCRFSQAFPGFLFHVVLFLACWPRVPVTFPDLLV